MKNRLLGATALTLILLLILSGSSETPASPTVSLTVVGVYWGTSVDKTIQVDSGDRNMPLSVTIQNTGTEDVKCVGATLNLSSSPFTNITGGSTAEAEYSTTVKVGSRATFSFTLNIAPDAERKTYTLNMTIYYLTVLGKEGVSLEVPVPLLGKVSLACKLEPSFLTAGNGTYTLSLTNLGTVMVQSITLVLTAPSPLMIVGGEGRWSIPSIPAMDNASVTVNIYVPENVAGSTVQFSVAFSYLDAYGYTNRESRTLQVFVVKMEVADTRVTISIEPPEAPMGVWRRVYGRLTRLDKGLGIGGATVSLHIVNPRMVVETRRYTTNVYGYWEGEVIPNIPGTYIFTVRYEGGALPETPTVVYNPSTAVATLTITSTLDVRCPQPWQATMPLSKVFFPLRITNQGLTTEKFILSITSLPEDWGISFHMGSVEVKAVEIQSREALNLTLEVDVPENATAGSYGFHFAAEGTYVEASYILTVDVKPSQRKVALYTPFLSQTALTGEGLSYPVKVGNEGLQDERVYLSLSTTTGVVDWRVYFIADNVTVNNLLLKAGKSIWVVFKVVPTYLVKVGEYKLNILATTEDGLYNATASLAAVIVGSYRLDTSFQPINPSAYIGEKGEFTVTVKNTAQSPVTGLRLNVTAIRALTITIMPEDVLSLGPNEKVDFIVRVQVPLETTTGDYTLRVQAVSRECVSEERGVVVSIKSAIPWFWIIIGIAVIATGVTVIALQRLLRGVKLRIRRS